MEQEREDGASKRRVLGLAEIQMGGASELLGSYRDRPEAHRVLGVAHRARGIVTHIAGNSNTLDS